MNDIESKSLIFKELLVHPKIKEVRGRGLFLGIELHTEAGPAKKYCEKLLHKGILCKDTKIQTMRVAPPLVVEEQSSGGGH